MFNLRVVTSPTLVRYVAVYFERIDSLGNHAIILLNQLSLIGKYFVKKNLIVLNLVLTQELDSSSSTRLSLISKFVHSLLTIQFSD